MVLLKSQLHVKGIVVIENFPLYVPPIYIASQYRGYVSNCRQLVYGSATEC